MFPVFVLFFAVNEDDFWKLRRLQTTVLARNVRAARLTTDELEVRARLPGFIRSIVIYRMGGIYPIDSDLLGR